MGLFEEDEVMKKEIAEQKAKNARLLGTWVTVMFWFQIVAIAADVLSGDVMEGFAPVVYYFGVLLGYVIMMANSVILIRLKVVEDWFGKAGVCYLVSGVGGVLVALLGLGDAAALETLLLLVILILQIRGNYDECTGYETVLRDVDFKLSQKWALQWILEMVCSIGIIVSIVLCGIGLGVGVLPFTIIGGFLMLLLMIAGFVVGILRLIYLYRTAETFREYEPEDVTVE